MYIFRICLIVVMSALMGCVASHDDSAGFIGKCPQPRFTEKAPADIYGLTNPLQKSVAVMAEGEELFMSSSAKVPCMDCHGEKGDGRGVMASMFDPPPRNFCCAKTVDGVPDGQLFWIIKNGSPGTSMPGFDHLSDEKIWQLVHYIRKLSKQAAL